MELLAQILTDGEGNRVEGGQIAQGLMTREQRQQRQVLRGVLRVRRDKIPFLLGRRRQRLEFLRAQRGFETRIGRAFDGGHSGELPCAVSRKGSAGGPDTPVVFPGETAYRRRVYERIPYRPCASGTTCHADRPLLARLDRP